MDQIGIPIIVVISIVIAGSNLAIGLYLLTETIKHKISLKKAKARRK